MILYVIGQTYKEIEDDTIEPVPHNALMLLAQTPSDGALGAMRQFMRQTDKFHYYYLGDITEEVIVPALFRTALHHTPRRNGISPS